MTDRIGPDLALVSMEDGEDWLLRPVMEGMCSYESLINCALTLEDISVMNEALDVKYENQARVQEFADRNQR